MSVREAQQDICSLREEAVADPAGPSEVRMMCTSMINACKKCLRHELPVKPEKVENQRIPEKKTIFWIYHSGPT